MGVEVLLVAGALCVGVSLAVVLFARRSKVAPLVAVERPRRLEPTAAVGDQSAPPRPPYTGSSAAQRFLQETGPSVGPGAMEEGEDGRQWRTSVEHVATRIRVESGHVHVELRRSLPIDSLELHWDPKLLPSDGKKDVWDDDPPLFVGPGLVVSQGYEMGQNPKKIVGKRLEEWGRLEPRVQEDIAHMMGEFRVSVLSVDERGASLELAGQLREMLDPKPRAVGAIQALSRIVRDLSELPPVDAAFDAEAHRATCEYCRSLFLWTHAPKCSNCGAPLAG